MSNLQNVPTVVVQDYEYGTDGRPLANVEVTVRLAVQQGLVSAGVTGGAPVNIEPIESRVKTDANGFWSIPNIVRNSDITPGGTYYTVKVGLIRQYQIQVPAGAGPFTASAILLGALPFFPSGSSVAGPITITGNLTVTGTGNFAGALTASAGLTVLGGGSVSGGLTVAGALTMSDTASRIVPGATSFSVRDNGNLNDNLLVSNAGIVTARAGLVAAAGGANITGDETLNGRLVMVPSAAKVVAGATSLSLRNNADNADNLLVADNGNLTARGPLNLLGSNVGAGSLGYAQATANQTGITTETSLTGLSVTVTVAAGSRRIRVSFVGLFFDTVSGDQYQVNIKEGATVLQQAIDQAPAANFQKTLTSAVVLVPAAGSHTYNLTLQRITGTGTSALFANATAPAYILVEDIGT